MVKGVEDGEGELAFLKVVALGLAYVEALVEVEDVIAHLEAESHEVCEVLEALYGVGIGTAEEGAGVGTGLEEDGGLLGDDLVVGLFAEDGAVGVVELQELAVGEGLPQKSHAADNLEAVGQGDLGEGLGGDEVAHEDGGLVVEERVHGALSAPHGALIDDVVVDEAGGVEHLQPSGSMKHLVGDGAPFTCAEDDERGAHHLAQLTGEMGEGGSEELVVGLQGRAEDRLVALQLGGYELLNIR